MADDKNNPPYRTFASGLAEPRLYKLFGEVSSTATEVYDLAVSNNEIKVAESSSQSMNLATTYIDQFKPVELVEPLEPATPSLDAEHEEWLRGVYKEIWEDISNKRQDLIDAGKYDAAKPELFRCVDAYIDMMNSDQINSLFGQIAAAVTLLLCWLNVIKKDLLTINITK